MARQSTAWFRLTVWWNRRYSGTFSVSSNPWWHTKSQPDKWRLTSPQQPLDTMLVILIFPGYRVKTKQSCSIFGHHYILLYIPWHFFMRRGASEQSYSDQVCLECRSRWKQFNQMSPILQTTAWSNYLTRICVTRSQCGHEMDATKSNIHHLCADINLHLWWL